MFYFRAPAPTYQTMTVLPSPLFSDAVSLTDAVSTKYAIDGTRRTYVKTKGGRRKIKWVFLIDRNKGLELRCFIEAYYVSQIFVVDHLNREWLGYFTGNPFDFETTERAYPPRQDWPRGEVQTITIDFEGVQLSGSPTSPPPLIPPTPGPGLTGPPSFIITSPSGGSFTAGAEITIQWAAENVPSGSNVSLCYMAQQDASIPLSWSNAILEWLEIGEVTATNGPGSYTWTLPVDFQVGALGEPYDTTIENQYWFGGYLYANSTPTYSIASAPVEFVPMFTIESFLLQGTEYFNPSPLNPGQTITIEYQVSNAPRGSTISLCYMTTPNWPWETPTGDTPAIVNWIEINEIVTESGTYTGTYNWTVPEDFPCNPNTYYWFGGYLFQNGAPIYTLYIPGPFAVTA
jgi:hypothetical protein